MLRSLAFLTAAILTYPCIAQSHPGPSCSPQRPDVYSRESIFHTRSLLRVGNQEKALAFAQQQVAQKPASAAAQVALAEAELAGGDAAKAIAGFNQALKLYPCNATAHYDAWRLESLSSNNAAAARQQLELAHELDPSNLSVSRTWAAVHHAQELAGQPAAPVILPEHSLRDGFFAKSLDCNSIPIRSSAAVHDDALILACAKMQALLANLPDARKRLHSAGAELHIIGEREHTSDLPENRRFKNQPYIDAEGRSTSMDQRTRGVGGLRASCGEENLLFLPADRYDDGSDTCTHEFSHALRNFGLSGRQRSEIDAQYSASLKAGLWKGAYAGVNADEFFAEITMWYFGTHGQFVPGGITTPGPEALRVYDPAAYAVLQRVYGPPPAP